MMLELNHICLNFKFQIIQVTVFYGLNQKRIETRLKISFVVMGIWWKLRIMLRRNESMEPTRGLLKVV